MGPRKGLLLNIEINTGNVIICSRITCFNIDISMQASSDSVYSFYIFQKMTWFRFRQKKKLKYKLRLMSEFFLKYLSFSNLRKLKSLHFTKKLSHVFYSI